MVFLCVYFITPLLCNLPMVPTFYRKCLSSSAWHWASLEPSHPSLPPEAFMTRPQLLFLLFSLPRQILAIGATHYKSVQKSLLLTTYSQQWLLPMLSVALCSNFQYSTYHTLPPVRVQMYMILLIHGIWLMLSDFLLLSTPGNGLNRKWQECHFWVVHIGI